MGFHDDFTDYAEQMEATAIDRTSPSVASGMAAPVAPEGTTWVPELGTYVDADVAASLGIGTEGHPQDTQGSPDNPRREPHMTGEHDSDPADTTERDEGDGIASDTFREMVTGVDPDDVDGALALIEAGDFDGTLATVSETLGLDTQAASTLIGMAVEDTRALAEREIGTEAYNALVYAAGATPDPIARRVLTDIVTGKVPGGLIGAAYSYWYNSLPDAD
ncbi:MAG: hypothetical protein CMJ42_20220 [Phyllobacteriaceae bacterium]|nr:hypothetical protein [Phyllobacteriaceae bacterium]MBA90261.1 hypothetical protein [Phyllobacteriaceae bacterium]